jgi:outer membrane protein assembly factor BamB
MADRKGREFAVALDANDGTEVWSTAVGNVGQNEKPQHPGARSTPTVDGDRLYVLGSDGDLTCLARDRGAVLWTKNLKKDFGGKPGAWAYAESVLIDGDTLVCTPGGKEATMVALNKKDGSVIWKCALGTGDPAAYSSAITAVVGDVRMYVQFVQGGVVGVGAKTGACLWRYDQTRAEAANMMTPVFHSGAVFTSLDGKGSGLTRLVANKGGVTAAEVYFTKGLGTSIGGVVRVGDCVYGAGREGLTCLEWATGQVKWKDKSVDTASLCYADGHLYVRDPNGTVALVEANPAGYKERGRFEQPDRSGEPTWPHPVVSNGRLYLRDGSVLLCYDVKAGK